MAHLPKQTFWTQAMKVWNVEDGFPVQAGVIFGFYGHFQGNKKHTPASTLIILSRQDVFVQEA